MDKQQGVKLLAAAETGGGIQAGASHMGSDDVDTINNKHKDSTNGSSQHSRTQKADDCSA